MRLVRLVKEKDDLRTSKIKYIITKKKKKKGPGGPGPLAPTWVRPGIIFIQGCIVYFTFVCMHTRVNVHDFQIDILFTLSIKITFVKSGLKP